VHLSRNYLTLNGIHLIFFNSFPFQGLTLIFDGLLFDFIADNGIPKAALLLHIQKFLLFHRSKLIEIKWTSAVKINRGQR